MQLYRYIYSLIALALITNCTTESPKIYYASDFGILPNTQINNSPLVAAAIEQIRNNKDQKNTILLFEKGEYNFYPQGASTREYYISNHDQENPKILGFAIENMHNFTIDGAKSEFLFHGRMLPIALVNSTNCTLKNFSIDNPNPQIAQVEIIENDTIKGEITYKVAEWVKYKIEKGNFIGYGQNWEHTYSWGIAFDKQNKHIVYNTSDIEVGTKQVIEIAPYTIRAKWNNKQLKPSTIVAMRSYKRPTPGIFISHNTNTTIKNISIHYAEGMGVLAQMSENIQLDSFNVALRGHDDPRYFTTQADATHFSACK
ncbi:MAG: alpha-1,3-galactosidase B, partial [Bacteroidales bacterium]